MAVTTQACIAGLFFALKHLPRYSPAVQTITGSGLCFAFLGMTVH